MSKKLEALQEKLSAQYKILKLEQDEIYAERAKAISLAEKKKEEAIKLANEEYVKTSKEFNKLSLQVNERNKIQQELYVNGEGVTAIDKGEFYKSCLEKANEFIKNKYGVDLAE